MRRGRSASDQQAASGGGRDREPSGGEALGGSSGGREGQPVYTSAVAAQLVGLAPRTIRAYEEAGLIQPARIGRNKQRLYSAQDLRWLRCIHEMVHEEGYTLKAIRRLLDFVPCWEIRQCPEEIARRCAANLRIPGVASAAPSRSQQEPAEATDATTGEGRSIESAPVHIKLIYGLQEFGTVMHCSRCIHAERRIRRVALEYGDQVAVTKHDILSQEARRYGVLMTPAVVINDEVVSVGKAPSEARLRELIDKYLAARLREGK